MSRVASLRKAASAARPALPLSLLAGANLLAAIGGGRVLSAGTGITGLAVLGSGSILALLAGNALGLGLQISVRRFPPSGALIWLSLLTVFSSLALLGLLWLDARPLTHQGVATIWNGGRGTLSEPVAWLFFLGVLVRCALWFAGRSLRSGLAASWRSSWLAFTEAAYFLGFIIGWLIKPVPLEGVSSIVAALIFDLFLLALVAGGDLFRHRAFPQAPQPPLRSHPHERPTRRSSSWWRLTAAFCTATVACQVVLFHCADVLAQTRQSAFPSWSESTIAVFYLGVACAATGCAWARPMLETGAHRTPHIVFWPASCALCVPLLLLVTVVSILTLAGIAGLMTLATGRAILPAVGLLALAAVGIGAGLFETLVLATLERLRAEGSGAVALAFGVAATTAAGTLFLMLLCGLRFPGWALTTVIGFALTVFLLWQEGRQSPMPSASRQILPAEAQEPPRI